MAWYPARGGGIPASVKTDMNAVLNKKFGTQGETYPPKEWADDVNLMGVLPIRTASGTIAHFEDGADDVPLKSLTAQILPIQEGTGDPSPSNFRPISGTSVLNVANVSDYASYFKGLFLGTLAFVDLSTLTWQISGSGTFFYTTDITTIPLYSAGTVLSAWLCTDYNVVNVTSSSGWQNVANKSIGSQSGVSAPRINIRDTQYTTLQDFQTNVKGYLIYELATPTTPTITAQQFATLCTAFNITGSTYPIALGRTVYGGTYNSETGVLTVTKIGFDFGSEDLTWIYNSGQTRFYCTIPNIDLPTAYGVVADILCSCYKTVKFTDVTGTQTDDIIAGVTQGETNYITCRDTRYTDAQSFKTGLTGQKFVVNLATPVEIQLTPTEINSLLGVNNVWTDTGDTEVEYRADIDLLLASLEGNRGLQMMRATPTEENDEQEATENEDER